ncbi:hypothetical protein ElyMa_007012300 [Elysia marginata]|uniref:Uncharacterized protein n=1 Tax=Elysia marginata TaxID=1093978 RepID=A0AAV4JR72_9GAST|nr:hypothetical protein ElyMa_007012300 [Elysia marginata]
MRRPIDFCAKGGRGDEEAHLPTKLYQKVKGTSIAIMRSIAAATVVLVVVVVVVVEVVIVAVGVVVEVVVVAAAVVVITQK